MSRFASAVATTRMCHGQSVRRKRESDRSVAVPALRSRGLYARGGGSSGARVSDRGAITTKGGAASGMEPLAGSANVTLRSAAGAHGAIVWQPLGAQGN